MLLKQQLEYLVPPLLTPSLPESALAECTPVGLVRAFAKAADARDGAALERLLHPEFRVVFNLKGSTESAVLPRATWFSMLEAGKLGGVPRTLTIHSSSAEKGLATVVATLDGASGRFESAFTTLEDAGCRRIVQDAVVFTPAGK